MFDYGGPMQRSFDDLGTPLCAVTFAVAGMLIINRLPKLHHPLFGTARFGLASEDRFFLYIDASDPKFDAQRTRSFLGSLGAWSIEAVRP